MLRKLIYGFFVALLGLLIFFLYWRMEHKATVEVEDNIFEMIPHDAGLVIHSNNPVSFLHQIHHENLVWKQLRELPLFSSAAKGLHYIDSLITNGEGLAADIKLEAFSLSVHSKGNADYSPLLILELSQEINASQADAVFKSLYGSDVMIVSKVYNDFTLSTVKDTLDRNVASYFTKESALIWSTSDMLIENCIGDISNKNGLGYNVEFKEIAATAGKKVDANVFLNFDSFASIMAPWINSEHYVSENSVRKMGNWAALDLHGEGQAILMDGFLSYGESDEFMTRLKNQKPTEFNAINIMPQNTRYFHCMGINDLNTYLLYYPTSVDKKKKLDSWCEQWETTYGARPLDLLKDMLGEELVKVSIEDQSEKTSFLVLKLRSNTTATELFSDFLEVAAEKQKRKTSSYIKNIKVDAATNYSCYTFPLAEVIEKYFGLLFESEGLNSFVFYDNFLVIGENTNTLKSFLYQNLLGQTLIENQHFVEFNKNLSSKSNFQMYVDFRGIEDLQNKLFTKSFNQKEIGSAKSLKALNAVGFQLVSTRDNVYSNLYIDYAGERKEEVQAIWKSLLDTTFVMKPTLVENHYTREKEIVVQDLKNILYLISPSGRIIWKKALGEPILGRIFQVDKFKNGKLQLLFNTASKIHLLDRNGNYLKRYPIILASKATEGIGLVDYDKNRDYRIFVPCRDKSVLLFDKEGTKMKGWKFGGADYPVNSRIQHFRIGSKDFIVFADKNRIYLLNRQGQVRLRLKEQFSKAQNTFFYFDEKGPKGEPCIVTTDVNGDVKYIHLNGDVQTKKLGIKSAEHSFRYADLNGDKREELIFTEGKDLLVFNEKGTRLFEYKFKNNIEGLPYIYEFSSRESKIGILNKKEQNLYLINSDGTTAKGFPLTGTTPFTLGFLDNAGGSFNLLTGGRGNFLYNFRVK